MVYITPFYRQQFRQQSQRLLCGPNNYDIIYPDRDYHRSIRLAACILYGIFMRVFAVVSASNDILCAYFRQCSIRYYVCKIMEQQRIFERHTQPNWPSEQTAFVRSISIYLFYCNDFFDPYSDSSFSLYFAASAAAMHLVASDAKALEMIWLEFPYEMLAYRLHIVRGIAFNMHGTIGSSMLEHRFMEIIDSELLSFEYMYTHMCVVCMHKVKNCDHVQFIAVAIQLE